MVVLGQLAEDVRGQLVAVVGYIQRDQIGGDVVKRRVTDLQYAEHRDNGLETTHYDQSFLSRL